MQCKDCPATYVGETKRAVGIRVNEHKIYVFLKKEKSVISVRCNTKKHKIEWNDVIILDRVNIWNMRVFSEMLNIHAEKSPLNRKEDTNSWSKFYKQLLSSIH